MAWQKGTSGNPKGGPKGMPKAFLPLTITLKHEIEKMCPEDKKGRTWRHLLVLALMRQAFKGNQAALKEIWQRLDGKVPQPIVGAADTEPISIKVVLNPEENP